MSGSKVRLVMAQLSFWVGDIQGNLSRIRQACEHSAERYQAEWVVFPELSLTGYPPEDLLFRSSLSDSIQQALDELCRTLPPDMHVVVGYPEYTNGTIYNAAAIILNGSIIERYRKQRLPNYNVFDEKRYFSEGDAPCIIESHGIRFAITICEDIWSEKPARQAAAQGANWIININASPYHIKKLHERESVLTQRCQENNIPVIYVNMVGGQDELVFDGQSMICTKDSGIVWCAPAFEEGLFLVTISPDGNTIDISHEHTPALSEEASVYSAITLGIRDYVQRNRFKGVVLGLSGGIDSALTLALAVDALGPDKVEAVMMPSRYTSGMSLEDARTQAQWLGIHYDCLSVEKPFEAMLDVLSPRFTDYPADVTEENLQSRCRGVLLMGLSNKFNLMVLTTGNKSEMAVGYATLYGDMIGGFAPLKDLDKTRVFKLARYRNTLGRVIPDRVLDRPPSAELRADQRDTDSLPPYEVLDPILELYVEENLSEWEICARGFDLSAVQQVIRLIQRNEYKRRQAPPGVKITRRAFGRDWRLPITAIY